MRVAYVCTDPGVPVFGRKGCSIHVQEVLREFVRRGWSVDLFARRFDDPPPQDLAGIRCCNLGSLPSGLQMATREQLLLKLDRTVRLALETRGSFDLIYERYALWSSAAMKFSRDSGIPSVLEVNAPLVEECSTHRKLVALTDARRVSAEAFESAGVVIGVSQAVANHVRAYPGVDAHKIRVITNGVNVSRFAATGNRIQARWEARASRRSSQAPPLTIGFVGSLRPWHGMEILGHAFRQFHEAHPQSRLCVVGDGPARAELESALGGSARQATRIVGAVPHESVSGWMAEMDIAVAPYPQLDSDSFYFSPLKILEYMAAGLPIVASRLGDIPDIVRHNVEGLLVEPSSPQALVDAWERLAQAPRTALRLSRQAAQRAADQFTWRQVVDQSIEWGLAASCGSRFQTARRAV